MQVRYQAAPHTEAQIIAATFWHFVPLNTLKERLFDFTALPVPSRDQYPKIGGGSNERRLADREFQTTPGAFA